MNIFRYLLLIFSLSACAFNPTQKNEYQIKLHTARLDQYEVVPGAPFVRPSNPSNPYNYERIIKLPEQYTVKESYNINLQPRQTMYQIMVDDTTERDRLLGIFVDRTFEDWQDNYTLDSIDCIVSLCSFEDSTGNKYMIFDQNNDEDLTNDPITPSKTGSYYNSFRDTTIEFTYFDAEVQFEYYDGSKIMNDIYGLQLREPSRGDREVYIQYAIYGQFGRANIEGREYTIGIYHSPEIEYNKYNSLWIDLNQNMKKDINIDHAGQMYHPFTLGDKAFIVSEIDRFGNSITLTSVEADSIPPIAVGLPAPDFTETTIDSIAFNLSDYSGKVILLDFWTCNGPMGLSWTNKVYQNFADSDQLRIVTFGLLMPEYLTTEEKEIEIAWTHINDFSADNKARLLYQVGSEHITFVIDPNGIILAKKFWASEDKMIDLINRTID